MSVKQNSQRIAILIIALVFFLTAVGTVAFAVYDNFANKDSSTATTNDDLQKQLEELQKQQANACNIQQPVTGVGVKPAPETFKPGADVTQLATTDIVPGNGQEAKNGDCLVVKYLGTLAADGTKFDGNFDQDSALQFTLGQGDVIPGWDQGLTGLKVGGQRRVVIPAELGYGAGGSGSIPPNSDLVFVVELVNIKQANQ